MGKMEPALAQGRIAMHKISMTMQWYRDISRYLEDIISAGSGRHLQASFSFVYCFGSLATILEQIVTLNQALFLVGLLELVQISFQVVLKCGSNGFGCSFFLVLDLFLAFVVFPAMDKATCLVLTLILVKALILVVMLDHV